jgi:hypothetical protein
MFSPNRHIITYVHRTNILVPVFTEQTDPARNEQAHLVNEVSFKRRTYEMMVEVRFKEVGRKQWCNHKMIPDGAARSWDMLRIFKNT